MAALTLVLVKKVLSKIYFIKPCLLQVGSWSAMTGYALAFPHHSKFKHNFNAKILELRENGNILEFIQVIYNEIEPSFLSLIQKETQLIVIYSNMKRSLCLKGRVNTAK